MIFSWRAAHRFGITHAWLRAGRKCGAFNRVRSRNSCCNAAVTGTRRRQFEQHQRLQYECIKSSAVINIGRKARTTGMGASSASLSISKKSVRSFGRSGIFATRPHMSHEIDVDRRRLVQSAALTVAATQLVPRSRLDVPNPGCDPRRGLSSRRPGRRALPR